MSEWQPIETAPKDGTIVVLMAHPDLDYEGEGIFAVGEWDAKRETWSVWFDAGANLVEDRKHDWPTHWMPLPAPPAGAQPR